MRELRITRTVCCPKEQIVEKEIWGDTVKQYKKNWPLSLDRCKECDYHGGIKRYVDGEPPKVFCHHDEAPLRAEIKALKKAQEIIEIHGGSTTHIEEVLNELMTVSTKEGYKKEVKNKDE